MVVASLLFSFSDQPLRPVLEGAVLRRLVPPALLGALLLRVLPPHGRSLRLSVGLVEQRVIVEQRVVVEQRVEFPLVRRRRCPHRSEVAGCS